MHTRFDLSSIESCSEIPACRGPEVLSILIEVDPISGKEAEQYPDAYPKKYRERVENFSRNYIWRKITGDITIEFLEAAVERMFNAEAGTQAPLRTILVDSSCRDETIGSSA